MANYNCTYRTNYFRVTDETRYHKLISNLNGEDIECFEDDEHPGFMVLAGLAAFSTLMQKPLLNGCLKMSRPAVSQRLFLRK